MNNIILEFLESYKKLDELCKQILSSDRGVSAYIDVMSNEYPEYMTVACWKKDYKQLKKMRWIRNKLVHEANSFQENLINVEDIVWLKTFYSRILECTDPFSLLYQSRNIKREIINQNKKPEDYSKINGSSRNADYALSKARGENYSKKNATSRNQSLVLGVIMLIGSIILIGIVIFAIIYCFVIY